MNIYKSMVCISCRTAAYSMRAVMRAEWSALREEKVMVSVYRPHFQATTCAAVYHIWRKAVSAYNAILRVKALVLMLRGHGKSIKAESLAVIFCAVVN